MRAHRQTRRRPESSAAKALRSRWGRAMQSRPRMLSVALFGDLPLDLHGAEPLVTGDIPQPSSPAELRTPELLQLAELAVAPGEASAGWIQDVASSLTTTERKVLEQGGPSIVVRGVVMRMRLAKVRAVGNR